MRAAGIGARTTAYRWLHRYDEGGEAALQRRPYGSKHSNKSPDTVAQKVIALAGEHPGWGRRRLAAALAQSQPPTVMSASTVALVLSRTGFWPRPVAEDPSAPPDSEPSVIRDRRVNQELLADLVMRGLRASHLSASSVAAALLYERVWKAIWLGEVAWYTILPAEPLKRNLLLRSRVQAGHSLMNTGQWWEAAAVLEETRQWMWETERTRFVRNPSTPPSKDLTGGFSVVWDDIWLHCLQLLGIVLRNRQTELARIHFNQAIDGLTTSGQRRRVSSEGQGLQGNLQRDFAKMLLLREGPTTEVLRLLTLAQRNTEEAGGDPGMMGATHTAWAHYYSAQAASARNDPATAEVTRPLDLMQESAQRALKDMRQAQSPILETIAIVGSATLYLAHGLPVDRRQLEDAATYALRYGYGGQARQLLRLPGLEDLLPSAPYVTLRQTFASFGGHSQDGY